MPSLHADVEENKVVQYKRMYAAINMKVLGLAMNLAGGVGPTLLRVIKRCSEIAGGRISKNNNKKKKKKKKIPRLLRFHL